MFLEETTYGMGLSVRIADKIKLVSEIGRKLQAIYTYAEINTFFAEFGIAPSSYSGMNSKWAYSKAMLSGVPERTIIRIANELELSLSNQTTSLAPVPRNWEGTTRFRLFISHISKDKVIATRLKNCLASYAILGFVAHEDIHPTLEWQSEIEHALCTMDGFIAIHTPEFFRSYWTQQEIGFALGRNINIIPFKMGEDPTGFISKRQALARRGRNAEQIAQEIDNILGEDTKTSELLLTAKRLKLEGKD